MLDSKYNHKETEKSWQKYWQDNDIHKWQNNQSKENTFVIDTPPPTVSGVLHMGHVFSYTQADFIARFQRMIGKDVFYPMGFDDNGLPTERLVEKVKKIRANQMPREEFIAQCKEIVDEAEVEFEALFNSIALSVDWSQKYQTISKKSQKLSQSSFVDLYKKGLIERKFAPVIWDVADQTALSQADLEDKEMDSKMNYLNFEDENGEKIEIMTTRPELLPACVALMINSSHEIEDETGVKSKKWAKYLDKSKLDKNGEGDTGHFARSAVFGVKIPIIADNDVKTDKGTGAVMCCTFGDETDVNWWRKYSLDLRVTISDFGKLCELTDGPEIDFHYSKRETDIFTSAPESSINKDNCQDLEKFVETYNANLAGKKIKLAREGFIKFLEENDHLSRESQDIKHNVKCAERSGSPIEFIAKTQWYIKLTPFKEELIEQINKCNWHPDFMKVRAIQWCEKITANWCISRQRFFGVPFPAWHVNKDTANSEIIAADFHELPIDPCDGTTADSIAKITKLFEKRGYKISSIDEKGVIEASKDGSTCVITPETDILDTWATSSISPQLSSGLVSEEMLANLVENKAISETEAEEMKQRHEKLFPADLRPQAHEIIRTWAFYTISKAYLHNLDENGQPKTVKADYDRSQPWLNAMISGWCLASDKTKMSKSKGNVVTPTNLIEEKGSDIVRYWTSTSNLGTDTAYSDEIFKIGHKLITKLFNASKFASMHFELVEQYELPNISHKNTSGQKEVSEFFANITQTADLWLISKLKNTIAKATAQFEKFEYAKAREAIEDFFWNDLCDNYLEIVKVRSYGLESQKLENIELSEEQKQDVAQKQISAVLTLKITLNTILKLFAPFTPHLCEEIYSNLFKIEFKATKSINAIGNWPKYELLPLAENHLQIGEESLKVISEVRKFKSDNNLSMKTTVKNIEISSIINLRSNLGDLKNVCNADEISLKDGDFNCKIEL